MPQQRNVTPRRRKSRRARRARYALRKKKRREECRRLDARLLESLLSQKGVPIRVCPWITDDTSYLEFDGILMCGIESAKKILNDVDNWDLPLTPFTPY